MLKFNALIPELSVSDFKKSIDFYLNILLFKLEYERKADKFAFLSLNESQSTSSLQSYFFTPSATK